LRPPIQSRRDFGEAGNVSASDRLAVTAATRRAALGAAAVTLLARLPFTASRMWDHDSIQFALGVERYNLAAHHPHPPGYPLYVAVLKLLARIGIDALHGMVALSALAGAAGAGLIVLLTVRLVEEAGKAGAMTARQGTAGPETEAGAAARGRGIWGAGPLRAGLLAAALYAFNPLLWFYGELPLIYAVEGGLTVAIAYAAVRLGDSRRAFLSGCALFALAGGLRQSTMVLLGPLLLWGVYRAVRRGHLGWRRLAGGAALAGAIFLAWFIPLCRAAGGLAAYQRISSDNFRALLPYTSIVYGAGAGALAHNLEILLKWALQGTFAGAVALAFLWATGRRDVAPGLRRLTAALPWLLAWAAPPVLFFVLFHVTKAGYTLVHLPALLVAIAVAAAPALAHDGAGRIRGAAAILLAAFTGAALFLFGADRRPEQSRLWAVVRHEFNRGALATYERDLDRLLATLRRFPPETTVLGTVELSGTGAASAEGFLYPWQRHLQWYLPRYTVLWLVPEQDLAFTTQGHRPFTPEHGIVPVPPTTRRLLLVLSAPTGSRLPLPPGIPIGKTFYLVELPLTGRLRLGPLLLVAAEPKQEAA
jgi:hypothetical protein